MGVIKPHKLLLVSFLVWMFFYMQMEVTYLYDGSAFFPLLTLIGFLLSFLLGLISLNKQQVKPIPHASDKKIRQIIFCYFLFGALGVGLKLYSGFFTSGIFLAKDVFEKRLENMGQELTGGFLGVFGAVLFPFSVIAMLLTIYNYKLLGKLVTFIILIFGLYPFIETFYMGGRTIIVLIGTTILFVAYASYIKNNTLNQIKLTFQKKTILTFPRFLKSKRIWIPLILISVFFVTYSVNIVNKRLERFNYGDRTIRIWERTDYQWVRFDSSFKKEFYEGTKEQKSKMLGYHSLKHYFVHGVFEYIRLVNHLDKATGYYYGMYEFNVFFKFFKVFGIPLPSHEELSQIVNRKSVYSTFWGPFYIDFGFLGVIIMFFWGRFVKRVYIYTTQQHSQYAIFYGYLSTIIITSVFLNFLQGSSSYYLFAFFVTLLVFKFWPNNLKLVTKNA